MPAKTMTIGSTSGGTFSVPSEWWTTTSTSSTTSSTTIFTSGTTTTSGPSVRIAGTFAAHPGWAWPPMWHTEEERQLLLEEICDQLIAGR